MHARRRFVNLIREETPVGADAMERCSDSLGSPCENRDSSDQYRHVYSAFFIRFSKNLAIGRI
jgi:hypothetical protein